MYILAFHDLEYVFPAPPCLQGFFWEINWQSYGNSPVGNSLLFSCCFQDSLFIFNIWHLIMMCVLVCPLLGPTFLGFSVLPGLVCLFPLPNWGSCFSLFFQVSFQVLALVPLLLAPLWFGSWHVWRCSRVFLFFPCFFEFLFLHSVLVDCLFLPMFQIVDLNLSFFPSLLVPWIFLYFSSCSLHFFPYIFVVFSEFSEHPYHQCFELCIW